MSHLLKNLLVAIGVTLLLGMLYMVFKGGEEEGVVDTGVVGAIKQTDATLKTEQVLSDINKIEETELNDSIFEDKRFTKLTNYHIDIVDVPTGRDNPFLPVE